MQTTSTPFSLLDQWDSHLKFNGHAPRCLEEIAIAQADYEHARRLAEIKALAAKLALLDQFLRPLHARGIRLAKRDMTTWDHGKSLRILPPILESDDKLHAALIELGFREIERKDWGIRGDQVTLKWGRGLVVVIDVSKAPATQSQAVTP